MKTRTRIIATIGPASSSPKALKALLQEGVNVFRINMSHGSHLTHRAVISRIRSLATATGCTPAILMDLQGPKIRVGRLRQPLILRRNAEVIIVGRDILGDGPVIPTTYNNLAADVRPGSDILMDDGSLHLRVKKIVREQVVCTVRHGGVLKEHKGINLPNVNVSAPALTPKDVKDLKFGIAQRVDYVALSFVRTPADMKRIRVVLKKARVNIPVIAKIEKPEATRQLDEILSFADGVMVARGDLGVEMSTPKVPVLQKQIIQKANHAGKLVITATQMLESMIHNPFPTRAEASDVANAIFDGTDAVMLSGETAVGANPIQCVRTMRSIASQAEASAFRYETTGDLHVRPGYFPHVLAEAAFHAGREIEHAALMVFTLSGATAFYLSKLRPQVPLVALTPHPAVCRRLSLAWGVQAIVTPFGRNSDQMVALGEKAVLKSRLLKKGQAVIVLAGSTNALGGTNMMKIHKLGG